MLGAMIGDIVGSAYEFHNTKDYNFRLLTRESDFTDDSVLTLAVADWLMHDPQLTEKALVEALVRFGQAYPHPTGGYGGGFSTWLFRPEELKSYEVNGAVCGRCAYGSWGNGSAMRVSAVGWYFDSLERTEEVAAISAKVTHNHPEGIKGAQATAAAIFLARTGADKEKIRKYISGRFGYDLGRSWEELHRTYGWDSSCQGTVPEAIICFLESEDFEDAIRKAVAIGGDSDTLACITGGIAEAFYGPLSRPMREIAFSHLDSRLQEVYREFCERCGNYQTPARITPARITALEPGEIFVFGSNVLGFHGGGAARFAMERFGAEWGNGEGLQGQSYAIPTMEGIPSMKAAIERFIGFAKAHPELVFYVTEIACGIAGYRPEEIAPMLTGTIDLENVYLPASFREVILAQLRHSR